MTRPRWQGQFGAFRVRKAVAECGWPCQGPGGMEQAAGGLTEILRVRREKAQRLAEAGWPSFPSGLKPSHTLAEARSAAPAEPSEPEDAAASYSVGGRLLAIRGMGKAMFCDLWDRSGRLQIQIRKDVVGEACFANCKLLDIGDHVVVEGPCFTTRRGEPTLQARTIQLASKSLHPLPDKHAGLTDIEQRYRQRYVDLATNPEVREVFRQRSRIIRRIRAFLDEHDFLEVETPILHSTIGGAAARPFQTHHNALDMDLYCRIAPELYLKRLLVGGFERVYEIGRNFRNEGLSIQHNPEFTMLEFYWAYATYQDLMALTESMLRTLATDVVGSLKIPYGELELDFERPFQRLSVEEGLRERLGAEVDLSDRDALAAKAQGLGLDVAAHATAGHLKMDLFEHLWEADLQQPTFVYDFPLEVSPLSRRRDDQPSVAERFELYVAGREIANAFSELNDPDDQRRRFEDQVRAKSKGADETMDYDEDYCHALEIGMPPAAGEGIGIDRLVMLLTNAPSIRDVILFPQMRRAGG